MATKYVLGTDGKLKKFVDGSLIPENNGESHAEEYSRTYGEEVNKTKLVSDRDTLDYIKIGGDVNIAGGLSISDVAIRGKTYKIAEPGLEESIINNLDFVSPSSGSHYLPFNTYSDQGDDEEGTYAFADLDSKTQLNQGFTGDRSSIEVIEEFITIFLSSFLITALLEALYAQWKEDVRSKTDLTYGSYRQLRSMNILDRFIELLHKEANWPKTKSGALSALVAGLLFDLTNADLVEFLKDEERSINTGAALGLPLSLISFLFNAFTDAILNSQDVFNRVKLRLRRISLDSAYKNLVRKSRSTVNLNTFARTTNTYFFKYIVERINVGEKILSKYVLGDHPLGFNVDTRYLPNNALTRLAKSKKGPFANTIGHQSTSPLSMTQLSGSFNAGREIQKALVANGHNLKTLGSLTTKFKYDNQQQRISASDVKELENNLEAEYVPFYFHDLRNNEIMAFHAFIESISDSFNPSFNETDGYGRVESVKTYNKTTRNISVNFTLAAMNPDDHDYMWFCVNRLVAMCYPQWSKGAKVDGGFTQPFSQIPTASPVIRMRLGDLFKSNYSRMNLSRLFGVGDKDFGVKNPAKPQYVNIENANGVINDDDNSVKKIDSEAGKVTKGITPAEIDEIKKTSLGDDKKFKLGNAFSGATNPGDTVLLLPGIYPKDTGIIGQIFGAIGVKATIPSVTAAGRSYFKNNEYLKCKIKDISDSTSFLSFFSGPSDEGKSHNRFYQLQPLDPDGSLFLDFDILASQDSIIIAENSADNFNQATMAGTDSPTSSSPGTNLIDGLMRPGTDTAIYNPIVKAFESSRGRGLAGVITQLDYNYNDSTWETSRIGSKAPQFMRVQLTFSPIHDIPLGLDHKGFMRAPAYPTGKVNRTFFGEVYDGSGGTPGLATALENYQKLQKDLNNKM